MPVDTGGTSGGLAVYWDRAVVVPGAWVGPAPIADRWIAGGAMNATGKALDWLASSVLGGSATPESLVAEAAGVAPGADGLVFLPYLAGERSPIWDAGARGAFVGLTLTHGRAHLARAVLEAAALALRHVAAPILAAGLRIDELVVTGGTARDDTWNRIKADVLGVTVAVPAVREAAVLGAAIIASTAVGWHADVRAAIGAMVRIDHRHRARPRARRPLRRPVRGVRQVVAGHRPDRPAPARAAARLKAPEGAVLDSAVLSGQGEIPDRW